MARARSNRVVEGALMASVAAATLALGSPATAAGLPDPEKGNIPPPSADSRKNAETRNPASESKAAAKGADTTGADAEAAVGNAGDAAKADVFKDLLGDLKQDAPKGAVDKK